MAFRTIQVCSDCKLGNNNGELFLEVGGEVSPDFLEVPLGRGEIGYGQQVLYGTDGENRKNKYFVADVDGDYELASEEATKLQERTDACGGRVGFLCFKSCGAGLKRVEQVAPENGMEGYIIK